MSDVRLVERIDGTWCAFLVGEDDDPAVAPTDDAALGRLVRSRPGRFGVGAIRVEGVDPGLVGEPAANAPGGRDPVGPDAAAEVRRPGDA